VSIYQQYDGDWKSVVESFLGDKVGEGWYIRDDVSLCGYTKGLDPDDSPTPIRGLD
jgi:hypothetical protein